MFLRLGLCLEIVIFFSKLVLFLFYFVVEVYLYCDLNVLVVDFRFYLEFDFFVKLIENVIILIVR